MSGRGEDRYGGCVRYLRLNFASMLLALLLGAVAIFTTGCWMLAAQLTPVAISAAEYVGTGAVHLAAGVAEAVTMETHKDEDLARAEAHEREDIMERGDSCDQLAAEAPGVIELRKSTAGAPEYRELGLVDSLDDAQWAPITDKGDADGGWRPAVNFLQMNFSPPLTGTVLPDPDPAELVSPSHRQSEGNSQARLRPIGLFVVVDRWPLCESTEASSWVGRSCIEITRSRWQFSELSPSVVW